MARAPCCEKVGLRRGRWTTEEDRILSNYIEAHGEGSWRSLPKNAGLLRCGKSCRLRWMNYLRSDVKRGNISGEEEDMIIKLHASLGNRWSLIASHLAGRTDNEIKNYWNSHLSRKIIPFSSSSKRQVRPKTPLLPYLSSHTLTKRKGGRTSRFPMKNNKSSNLKTVPTASPVVFPEQTPIMPSTPSMEKESNNIYMNPSATYSGDEGGGGVIFDLEREKEDDTGMLCFNEILDDEGLLMVHPTGTVLSLDDDQEQKERQNGTEVININMKSTGGEEVKYVTSGEIVESGSASSSTDSKQLDNWHHWNWDFETGGSIVGLGGEEEDNILSWPWETPPQNNNGEGDSVGMDIEKQNAMVAWLLS